MQSNYWQQSWCIEVAPTPGVFILFGAAGDLAERKLYPSLYLLFRRGLFHEASRIIGCARSPRSDEDFRRHIESILPGGDTAQKREFTARIHYVAGDYQTPDVYGRIRSLLTVIDAENPDFPMNHLFYLAVPAAAYEDVIGHLTAAELLHENESATPWRHVVLEKPFGYDLESAQALDRSIHRYLDESQIYRIDHYLGKETVQNIAMLRFANIMFEPVWNFHYIDHVQITAAESIGVEHRAKYYERAGLLRDMFQNHMLEMLALAAMEMPAAFEADAVRDEKLKLIQSIRPFDRGTLARDFVRGQYVAGNGMPGYREEPGVAADSTTETFVAGRFFIDNYRWKGVPFYLRSGKRLAGRKSEIAVVFRNVPHSIFRPVRSADMTPDTLVLKVQPEEGMELTIQAKQPGPKLCMGGMTLNFNYADLASEDHLDAYARLLLDAMLGDQTLFIRSDVIAASWRLFSPVLAGWGETPLHEYAAGTEGPEAAGRLLFADNREWRGL